MPFRVSRAGALTGAVLGGLGRGLLAAAHLQITRDTVPVLFIAAAIGIVIGVAAGISGRPLAGAFIGAALTALVHVGVYPIVLLFGALGALLPPPWLEVVAVGALVGGLAGASGQVAARRASRG